MVKSSSLDSLSEKSGLKKLLNAHLNTSNNVDKDYLLKASSSNFKYSIQIQKWDFDAQLMNEEEALQCTFAIIEKLNVIEKLNLNRDKLNKFIIKVKENYKNPKYHNFIHAVDVLQCFYYLLVNSSVVKHLREIEIFSLAISCLCHDLAHSGFNNAFHVNSKSELAIFFNNKSVLENFHLSATFHLLRQSDFNFLDNLSQEDSKTFSDIVTSSILSTDMSTHSEFINTLKSKISSNESFSIENRSDALFLASSFLKCADISNVARGFETSKKWMKVLLEEFREQGKVEKEKGLALNPFAVEGYNEIEGQIGFINFVVKPLLELMNSLICYSCGSSTPFLNPFKTPLQTLQTNLIYWNKIKSNPRCVISPLPSPSSPLLQGISNKGKIRIQTESELINGRRKSLPVSHLPISPLSPKSLENGIKSLNVNKKTLIIQEQDKIFKRTRSFSISPINEISS